MIFMYYQDQGYGTERKKKRAPTPPTAVSIEKAITESTAAKETENKQQQQQPQQQQPQQQVST